jgi:hypothetical protein
MIISKPKKQALFAISVFTLICFGLGGYNFILISQGSTWFFNYLMAIIFLLIAHVLMLRLMFNYKIVSIGNNNIQVWYPLRFRTIRAPLNEMEYWEETIIQTKTGVFKQLEIVFPTRTIKMSIQENSFYQEAVNYLKKKVAQKRKK